MIRSWRPGARPNIAGQPGSLRSAAPEAMTPLELIRDVCVVEHDAKAEGVARTDAHTTLRNARARPLG